MAYERIQHIELLRIAAPKNFFPPDTTGYSIYVTKILEWKYRLVINGVSIACKVDSEYKQN